MNEIERDYLSHHGILGQKWGVRRYQNKDGSLTAAGKKRLQQTYLKNYNQAADEMNRKVFPKLDEKYKGFDVTKEGFKTKRAKQYVDELDSAWKKTYLNVMKKNNPELFQRGDEAVKEILPLYEMFSYETVKDNVYT